MITIVDYGLGNIQAFVHMYKGLGVPTRVARSADDLRDAKRVILPGVGAFDWAMDRLERSGMRQRLDELVLDERRPVLGVCVGMQMLAKRSDEGKRPGLGWIDGDVVHFSKLGEMGPTRFPHMGWNDAEPRDEACLFRGMQAPLFYFLHSYCVQPADTRHTLATTSYGRPFTSAVRAGNIWGVQFHPEKSHEWGAKLLANFAEV